jgi:hypothetical protein
MEPGDSYRISFDETAMADGFSQSSNFLVADGAILR